MTRTRLSPEERQAKLEAAHAQLLGAIESLTTSDAWFSYLRTMSRFHRYSLNNTLLIWTQCPEATQVAGFRTWQSLGRQVRKGSKGIAVLAPIARTVDVEDAETGTSERVRLLRGFRLVHVFDVSQTDGEPLATDLPRAELLTGDAPAGMWEALAAQVADAGYRLELVPEWDASTNGETDFLARRIRIASTGRDAASRARTLAHELTHAVLHEHEKRRDVAEIEAESTAYLIADHWGLDATQYSIPYIASWGSSDPAAVRATAERVLTTAKRIIGATEADAEAAA